MKKTAKKPEKRAEKKPKKITAKYLHNAGLAYLQKFAASRAHFESVLMRKVQKSCRYHTDQNIETCRTLVTETADKFERTGLLNDEVFAQGVANSLRRAGKSKKYIVSKMAVKGVKGELTTRILSAEEDGLELIAARRFVEKKRLKSKDPQKSLAAMGRAGYSYDISKQALKDET